MTTIPMEICSPPSLKNTVMELRAPWDWLSILLKSPSLASAPRGNGRPVMLLPGFRADDASMKPLATYLNYLDYNATTWGLGRNRGKVDADIERGGKRLADFDSPVALVGWSLGGVIARELARLHPDRVSDVVTMGTPIVGGPKYTVVGKRFARQEGIDLDAFEQEVHARNSLGFKQPITAIYSKTDGVVGWQAAIDRYNPQARNIEVNVSHLGLGVNATVWRLVAEALAASELA